MTAMAREALTLNWAGVETPWAERLIVGIVVTMLAGLYGAVGGKRTRRGSLLLLSCLVVALNARYFVWNMHDAIGFFIALYDPFIHVGLDSGGASAFLLSVLGRPQLTNATWNALYNTSETPGMSPCDPNWPGCGLLPYYKQHPSWAGSFYSEFVDSTDGVEKPDARRLTLRLHIAANTLALVLCFFQVCVIPGDTAPKWKRTHRLVGYFTAAVALLGCLAGVSMGLSHGNVANYGNNWAVVGWISMFLIAVTTLGAGVAAAVRKDIEAHKRWMLWFYGSLWGAFLAFRLLFILFGRLFIGRQSATTLIAVWGGAPVGVMCAEWSRRRTASVDKPKTA